MCWPPRQAVLSQVANLFAEHCELHSVVGVAAGLVLDYLSFYIARRVVELNRYETLARAVLEVLERTLVTGVVGQNEQEAVRSFQEFASLFDRKDAPVVCERVYEDCRVLPRLDNLVKVADATGLDGAAKRAVDPDCGIALEKVASNQIACGQVFVAGDCNQGDVVAFGPAPHPCCRPA